MSPQNVFPADIVDAHIHMYAAEAAADPRGWGRPRGESGWVNCVAPEGRRSLQGWADPEALMADMDAAGVSACVMLGWYWERQETCDLQNKWYAEWIRRYPGRLFAFAAVQPAAGHRAVESLERALDSGLCGIGELLPQAQGFALEDPSWRAVAQVAARRRIPVTLHVTDPQAPAAAGPRTALSPYLNTAREFPTVPFILAHWGGGAAIRGLAEDQSLPPNLYFDTAASPLLYDRGVFRRAVDRVGPGRILYGSDYPLLLYPRTEARPGFRRFLEEVAASGLSAEEARQVLGANVRGLLSAGLAPAPKPV